MQEAERFVIGEWYFAVRPRLVAGPGYLAWCAKGYAALGDHPLDIPADVDVRFTFDSTRDAAVDKLRAEIDVAPEKPPLPGVFRRKVKERPGLIARIAGWAQNKISARQRQLDIEILWPALKAQAPGPGLDEAREAFALHASIDPAWSGADPQEVQRIIEGLE